MFRYGIEGGKGSPTGYEKDGSEHEEEKGRLIARTVQFLMTKKSGCSIVLLRYAPEISTGEGVL